MDKHTPTQQEAPDWTGIHPGEADFFESFEKICEQAFHGIPDSDHHQAFFRGEGYDGKTTGGAFISSNYFGTPPPKLPTQEDIVHTLSRRNRSHIGEEEEAKEAAEIR